MSEGITIALITVIGTGAFSTLGYVIGAYISQSKTLYRIEQLEKKVEKHNNLIERMYALEDRQNVADEKIRVANHRIDDLEGAVH